MNLNLKKFEKLIGEEFWELQKKLIHNEEREFVAVCGRRWGKSMAAAGKAILKLLEPNKKVWIVAPTYELSKKVFEWGILFLNKIDPQSKAFKTRRSPYPLIDGRSVNGSVLECKSAENPKSLLGEEVDLEIVDEAAQIPREVYYTYIVPVTSSRKGQILFISTPRGKNWFYDKFRQVGDSNRIQSASIDSPHFSGGGDDAKAEWERLKKMYPTDIFNQEYGASFVEGASNVFKTEDIEGIINNKVLKDVDTDEIYIMGVDLAKVKDFTVITVINTVSNHVVYWEQLDNDDWSYQKDHIEAIAKRYNNARIILDSTGLGDPVFDDLSNRGLLVDGYNFAGNRKENLLNKLRIYIEQHNITIPDQQILTNELLAFSKELTPAGNVKYQAPVGDHDDAVMSLALAVWGLTGPATGETAIQKEIKKNSKRRRKPKFI